VPKPFPGIGVPQRAARSDQRRPRVGRGAGPVLGSCRHHREAGARFRGVRTRCERSSQQGGGPGALSAPRRDEPGEQPRAGVAPRPHESAQCRVGERRVAEPQQDRGGVDGPERLVRARPAGGGDVAQGSGITTPHGERSGEQEGGGAVRFLRRRTEPSTITSPGELNQISTCGNTAARFRTMPVTTAAGSWYSCTHWEKTPPSVSRARTIWKNSGV